MKSNEANYRCLSYTVEFACTDSTPRRRLIGIILLTSHHQQHTNTITCNNAVRPFPHSNYPSSLQFPSRELQQSVVFQIPFFSPHGSLQCLSARQMMNRLRFCTVPRVFPAACLTPESHQAKCWRRPTPSRHPKHPELLDSIE